MKELTFSKAHKKAIAEKVSQLAKVKKGIWSPQELAKKITQRRLNWIKRNLDEVLENYKDLSWMEKAYRIIYFDHMNINPAKTEMTRISENKIRIDSYNFCPYLEACKKLQIDTRFICKEIGKPSIQAMIKKINPDLKFARNYQNIRPYNQEFCEEYIELVLDNEHSTEQATSLP